jgi:kelch-like protein 2/3
VYNNHIYCIGGDDGQSHLSSAEIYNPESNSWSLIPTFLTIARSYAGILAIEKPLKKF